MKGKKNVMFLSFLVLFFFNAAVYGDEEKYTTKYDNIDFEEIVKSDRLLRNYVNCLMDTGKCTPEGNELKHVLPEALETSCAKCNETQKNGVFKIIKHLVHNKPDWWAELSSRYDPDGVYWDKYKDQWKEQYDI